MSVTADDEIQGAFFIAGASPSMLQTLPFARCSPGTQLLSRSISEISSIIMDSKKKTKTVFRGARNILVHHIKTVMVD